jgi:hypothetical protein
MYYIWFLALPLLLTGTTYINATYFVDKNPQLEKVMFDLIPLESIKPTILFEKFVYKPIIMCYNDDPLNKYVPGLRCDTPKPRFDL